MECNENHNYVVNVNPQSGMFSKVRYFETLDEAQDFVKKLVREGAKIVTLSQIIPMKVKIEVEF
ncbi:hypothetical protein LCM23_24960 [Cytobacillus kochii]|uniref:hypothetical protein n=1 Tax=Cytobacillus kochii TaxID=859143 RepID=UPI001CD3D225|nr:hypothetical protein [Cytobacillus kochii]MCA1029265.1 hypothetical protein [Cytobacillus kochii]